MGCLDGKTALVTGGARGIGAAIVRLLAAEGAHVVFAWKASEAAANELAAEIARSGGKVQAVQADVSSKAGVDALFAASDAVFGDGQNIDVLVSNAGIGTAGEPSSLAKGSEEQFDRLMATNAKGPFLLIQAALGRLRDHGRIVIIGSLAAKRSAPYSAAYGMSKRALQNLTFSTAAVVGKRGITCNLIEPGAIDTDFIAHLRAQPNFEQNVTAATPMGRMGTPDDIAGAVLMLCREEARWVTGNVIEATGGSSI